MAIKFYFFEGPIKMDTEDFDRDKLRETLSASVVHEKEVELDEAVEQFKADTPEIIRSVFKYYLKFLEITRKFRKKQ